MARPLDHLRNIGISAHIDSGKTTLTERILFYTGVIHAIHEVRGKDGVGAKMDHMELEREKGITITSACTFCEWQHKAQDQNYVINIIDTPGHVDFTIEVERALRVLDGAILVLCGVSGVQSQSITVDRQMRRYNVPRIAFINKLDRTGADPFSVTKQLREKLGHNAIAMQCPIGLEEQLKGVVDLIDLTATYFEGENGEELRVEGVPADMAELVAEKREVMIEALCDFDEELMELHLMEQEVPAELLRKVTRQATISRELTPVFMGSAYKNVGVQSLLDAVGEYLPTPYEVENVALDLDNDEAEVVLETDPEKPFVGYIFKLEDGVYGQLSYMRVYQGHIQKGLTMYNQSTQKKHNVGRLVRMHSNDMQEIMSANAGDIVAIFGIDCASGSTFTDGKQSLNMTSMFVPDPVIDMKIEPEDQASSKNLSKGLNRFIKEDPTFRVSFDEESSETVISGMGELHLEIYVERLRREYQVNLTTGAPQVAYREAITVAADFDYTHKKQTGGSGEYGRVIGRMEPTEEEYYEFEDSVKGGNIPKEFIPSVDKGFKECMEAGSLIGFPITNVKMTLLDGNTHAVDSSDRAFQSAGRMAFREAYAKAQPTILEPLMKVEIATPNEFQGAVIGNVSQRRGVITGTIEDAQFSTITTDVPLSEMFGYVGDLRSLTQGKAEFTMEFARYAPVPNNVKEELMKKFYDRANARRG